MRINMELGRVTDGAGGVQIFYLAMFFCKKLFFKNLITKNDWRSLIS